MIDGYFSTAGVPYVRAHLALPRLGVAGSFDFLVDTGAASTVLHPRDGAGLDCPFNQLVMPIEFEGVGGTQTYYLEPAMLKLGDSDDMDPFSIQLSIAKPAPSVDRLDSLLGRDVLNRLRMEYDFPQGLLGIL